MLSLGPHYLFFQLQVVKSSHLYYLWNYNSKRESRMARKQKETCYSQEKVRGHLLSQIPKDSERKKRERKKKVYMPLIHHYKHSKTIIRRLVCFLRKFLCPSNKSQDSSFIGVVASLALRLEDHLESVLIIILIFCSCMSEQKEKAQRIRSTQTAKNIKLL